MIAPPALSTAAAAANRAGLLGLPSGPGDQPSVEARILVVDDDERSLELLAAILEPVGETVVVARSGEEGLRRLADGDFAVAVLDISMPGMNGFELASAIKSNAETCHLPIIFLSGEVSAENVRSGYALGAVDYLFKPFEPELLRAKVSVFVDLARLRSQAAALSWRALHDPLTGLANRTLFLDRLESALGRLARDPGFLAVLFLDLDGFKQINDEHGHPVGDNVLRETAARIQRAIRATDTAARFGGDEFLILVEQLTNTDDLKPVVARVQTAIEQPLVLDGRPIRIRASIGCATATGHAETPEALIAASDHALLGRKAARRGRPRGPEQEPT